MFKGIFIALITPFKAGKIDFIALACLIERQIAAGVSGFCLLGTTAEPPALTNKEKEEILSFCTKQIKGRAKIIVGVGANSTTHTLENIQIASQFNPDAYLVVTPYYNKPNQQGIVEHYSAIAKSTTLPIIIYNIPSRTGVSIEPASVAYLASTFDNIVGIKQSCADMDKVSEIRMLCPEDFVIYSGDDSLTLPMLALGAHGVISVASHIFGSEIKSMIRNFKTGEILAARNMHKKLYPVFRALFMAPNPIPVKAALEYKGLIEAYVRKPLVTLNEDDKIKLFRVIDQVKEELNQEKQKSELAGVICSEAPPIPAEPLNELTLHLSALQYNSGPA